MTSLYSVTKSWLAAVVTAVTLIAPSHADETQKQSLTVYTYASFAAEWGPGPKIAEEFQKICDCTVNYISFDDGVALLTRLKIENRSSRADIILGLDNNLIAEARATGLFAPHNLEKNAGKALGLPVAWDDAFFLPFDYGWFAFVYHKDRVAAPPQSMEELLNGDFKLLLQDPRTSTPGLGLMLWVRKLYGAKDQEAWRKLNRKTVSYSKSWSEAYGLFLKGEADMVLSYTSSPAYHSITDNDLSYAAAIFKEGHYLQIETAGKLRSSQNPLADDFLKFMLLRNFQKHIPTANWMYPAVKNIDLPRRFAALPKPQKTLLFSSDEVAEQRKSWTRRWLYAQ